MTTAFRESLPGRMPPASYFAGQDVCAAAGFTLRPGRTRCVFDQDCWDFTGVEGISQETSPASLVLDFRHIRNPRWQILAKEYVFARLAPGHEEVRVLPAAFRLPLAVRSMHARLAALTRWLNWLTEHGVTALSQVTQQHCDSYLEWNRHVRGEDGKPIRAASSGYRLQAVLAVQEIAFYPELFSTDAYAAGFRPWGSISAFRVSGYSHAEANKTQPVPEETLQPLLAAVLYMIEHLGPHVVELNADFVAQRHPQRAVPPGQWFQSMSEAIARHVQEGRPFDITIDRVVRNRLDEGWALEDPLLRLNLRSLCIEAGLSGTMPNYRTPRLRPVLEAAVAKVGLEHRWGWNAALVPRADGQGEVPWTLPQPMEPAYRVVQAMRAACLLAIAALTGMRSSEIMEMPDQPQLPPAQLGEGRVRYRLQSKLVKGQPLGGLREEWITVEEAYRAAGIAQELVDPGRRGGFLFGRFAVTAMIDAFRAWVNGPEGQRLGLAPIPDTKVNLRMLRRTLALELAHRPGGLLAAKIHLKHLSVVTTEGYAARPGGSQATLLAEVAQEEQVRNRELTAQAFRDFQDGILPSGPGAKDLIDFFAFVDGQIARPGAPSVKRSDQEVLNLLARRAETLHLGVANYCWFLDPSKALCLKLAGVSASANAQPMAGLCDSARCPQATHHTCHRPVWASRAENTKIFIGSIGRGQKTERARLAADLARDERVLAEIDAATGTEGDAWAG
ncbi:site-specific integrase [Streptomyces sp. HUAS TT7]|uniref:site-specific integrase n=1 Tax=Streptomyces sp. HUAS TT7 TaxID=3447507 RepID=UPI003F65513E